MIRLRPALRLLPALLLVFALSGCDSGGGGGGGTSLSDLSLEAEGPSGTGVSVTRTFFYSEGGSPCVAIRSGLGPSIPDVPFSQPVDPPSDITCDSEPGDFDGVRVSLSPIGGGSPDLTVRLLSDGNQIDEATEPTSTNNVSRWVVEAGEVRSLGDLAGR